MAEHREEETHGIENPDGVLEIGGVESLWKSSQTENQVENWYKNLWCSRMEHTDIRDRGRTSVNTFVLL